MCPVYCSYWLELCLFSSLFGKLYVFQITEYEKDLADCRLLISQHEARMKTLQESMREAENKKRTLEEDVDSLREECAKLKAAGKLHAVS